jgi:protein-S-isoprenylcysteine O-methyltransferase Ste14
MVTQRTLPPTYFLFSLIAVIAVHLLVPLQMIVPYPLNLFGALPLVVGALLNLVADKAFKECETTVKPFQESSMLVTTGVYGVSRHPMYLGMVLILLGCAILLGSLLPFVIIPVFIVLLEIRFVRTEEAMLKERFGEAWLEYTERVRRWI